MSIVNTGQSANDGTGDTLRDGFILMEARLNQIVGITSKVTWAPGLAVQAAPVRQWTVQGGQAYAATSNHTAGATFAADLAAGKWLAVDVLDLIGDLYTNAPGKGGRLVAVDDGNGGADFADVQEFVDVVREHVATHELKSRLFTALASARNDLAVLLQGDSTGDSSYEFFYVMATSIAALFPAYTVRYIAWTHASTTWGTPATLQTGTGSKVITFYNGSQPGSTPSYWAGSRKPLAYDGKTFDLIITNYGLNVPSDWRPQAERLAEYLFTLRQEQPRAEVLVTIQPPDYNLLDRSANRADAQRWVCGLFGARIIDAYSRFQQLVAASGGATGTWYLDGLHPTVAGGAEWAKVALRAVAFDTSGGTSTLGKGVPAAAPTMVPNGNFDSWASGTSSPPSFWLTNSSCVQDTVFAETLLMSSRCMGMGTGTGMQYFLADEFIARHAHLGDIWLAARVRTTGTSNKPGTLFCAHSVSTSYTAIESSRIVASEGAGAFRWVFLQIPASFHSGKSDFWIGVYSGEDGEQVSIDRLLVGDSPLLADSNGVCAWRNRFIAADVSYDLTAGQTAIRGYTSAVVKAVKGGRVLVRSRDMPAGIRLHAECLATNQVQVYVTNANAVTTTVPATVYSFETGE